MTQQPRPGERVRVWLGALTGSPGRPRPGDRHVVCRVSHFNAIGQAYVVPLTTDDGRPHTGSPLYVSAAAILGKA